MYRTFDILTYSFIWMNVPVNIVPDQEDYQRITQPRRCPKIQRFVSVVVQCRYLIRVRRSSTINFNINH